MLLCSIILLGIVVSVKRTNNTHTDSNAVKDTIINTPNTSNKIAKKEYTVDTEELFNLINSYMDIAISSYPYLTYSANSSARSRMYEITIKSSNKVTKEEFDKIKLNITKQMFESLKQNSYSGSYISDNSAVCINFNLYVTEEKKYSKDWISISLLYLSKSDADLLMDFDQFYEKKG